MIGYIFAALGKLDWGLVNTHVLAVPGFGEIIAVIDQAVSSIDLDHLSAEEIWWAIEFFRLK